MPHHVSTLAAAYDQLHHEGVILAGGLTDLSQRATVYHHVFQNSGRNHVFPLIAAHGALWARGWIRFGFRLARVLAWQYPVQPEVRRQKWRQLEAFADALRDVNRRVCVDTYANYHFAARYGEDADAARFVPANLLAALNIVHAARRREIELSDVEKRTIFEAHFQHEQEHVVGPSVLAAAAALDWPVVRFIALRPAIGFAYLPRGRRLWFRNFADRAERVANGLRAFDLAARLGWSKVERKLQAYDILPEAFFADSAAYFRKMQAALCWPAG
jgi:hypothetical protein